MELWVKVIEARNLPAMDLNGSSNPYVRLQLGRTRFRTKVVTKCLNPYWGEEFFFLADDLIDELEVSVLNDNKDFSDDFLGQVKVPTTCVLNAEDKSLGTTWYSLQPEGEKYKKKDCGEICLNIFLSGPSTYPDFPGAGKSTVDEIVESSFATSSSTSRSSSPPPEAGKSTSGEQLSSANFAEVMQLMESIDQRVKVPSKLSGGVLLDKFYLIAPSELNALLFSPDSRFINYVSDAQGKTELQSGPWKFENDGRTLKRVVTYVNPAKKLMKSVKAFEEQTYLKASSKTFVVLTSVYTPDVPYGSSFRVELLFCITPGSELSSGKQSSHLVISWRVNFMPSMMKGMVQNVAEQSLKDSFEQYANCLSAELKLVDMKDNTSATEWEEWLSASLQEEPQLQQKDNTFTMEWEEWFWASGKSWELDTQSEYKFYLGAIIIIGSGILHHMRAQSRLEELKLSFVYLITVVILCGVLSLLIQQVRVVVTQYGCVMIKRGSKAKEDGWLLTVALIGGSNLAAADATGLFDISVAFTCNGKNRTSSITSDKLNPQWNEIYEFDAMAEAPHTLNVEVIDSTHATTLGHAEINLRKTRIADLSDLWVPLQGNLAQAVQSKLHLRIFLDDNRGGNVLTEYLAWMEKINRCSHQTDSAFQKLFDLPQEEFLISGFTCYLNRKMSMQFPGAGQLLLSTRIIGFHTTPRGPKTAFYFLWEDIEDIQEASPNLSLDSGIIVITLRKGRGQDAKHAAKIQDEEGRLKFHFQFYEFSFYVAHRTIMALWKARALSPEQKVRTVEEEFETEESGALVGIENVNMSEAPEQLTRSWRQAIWHPKCLWQAVIYIKNKHLHDLSWYMWRCYLLPTFFMLMGCVIFGDQVIGVLYHISRRWSFAVLLYVLLPYIILIIDSLMKLDAIRDLQKHLHELDWWIFAKFIMVVLYFFCWNQGISRWFGVFGCYLLSPFIIRSFYPDLGIQVRDSMGSLRAACWHAIQILRAKVQGCELLNKLEPSKRFGKQEAGVVKQASKEIESYTKGILLLLGDGYQFEKEMLIQLWMAVGFIKNEPMEINGAIYFEELISRGYILPSDSNFLYEVNSEKMSTDLDEIRDKSHYLKLESTSQSNATPAEILHASVVGDQINDSIFKTLRKFSRLRTLLFRCTRGSRLEQLPVDIFLGFESLVVLDLSRTDIKELPSSALKMVHLRYLDLSWTLIELLPETINSFQRLQTLKLRGCSRLWKLPREMKRLVELRHLDFDVLGQLVDMPERMGVLVNLRTLSSFIVGTQEGCSIRELRDLNNLTGEFCIARLEHVQSEHDAEMASLSAKKHLKKLELRWSDFPLQHRKNQDVDGIVKYLCPHPDLEELLIRCYSGAKFPSWIGLESFHKLACITLFKCEHVSMLPSMEKLPSLEYLGLYSLNSVIEVRVEVDHVAFPKLRRLIIDEMLNLNAWTEGEEGDFPCLVELTIKDCPKLPELPSLVYLSSLKSLVINSCPKVQFVDGQQLPPSLEFLMVEECPLIKERCLEGDGKSRDKIKHVQNVWIDQEAIFDPTDDDDDDDDDSEQLDENYREIDDDDGTEEVF